MRVHALAAGGMPIRINPQDNNVGMAHATLGGFDIVDAKFLTAHCGYGGVTIHNPAACEIE
eukprot:1231018-Amphidinium_carterae.1